LPCFAHLGRLALRKLSKASNLVIDVMLRFSNIDVERDRAEVHGMQIHLSKPGGEKEGPFTLEEINQALAGGKLDGGSYWAWYDGLDRWVPLYSVSGIVPPSQAGAPDSSGYDTRFLAAEDAEPALTGTPPAVPSEASRMTAGMPFSALEQIFILTTGDGPAASRSTVTASLLREVIGEDWETIRQIVPRDAIGNCAVLSELAEGTIPAMLWKVMTAFKPLLLQQAREGAYRICIRSFQIETGDLVSVFLFYSKDKLK
jgi:hypothetical protein